MSPRGATIMPRLPVHLAAGEGNSVKPFIGSFDVYVR
jgi:hypothetical protein